MAMKRRSATIVDEDAGNSDDIEEQLLGSDGEEVGNAGWADAISKVLRTTKPKKKKTLVLSRAKKLTDSGLKQEVKAENPGFEIDGEVKEEKEEKPVLTISSAKLKEIKRKRKVWENMCRAKPNILEKEREKALTKTATKGVVQLFNAVRQQQKSIEAGLKAAGGSERKQEKVLRSVDKNSFLDILMGSTRSSIIGQNIGGASLEDKKVKKEDDEEEEEDNDSKAPLWSVLRDDFLVGGKLKDWDRDPKSKSVVSDKQDTDSASSVEGTSSSDDDGGMESD